MKFICYLGILLITLIQACTNPFSTRDIETPDLQTKSDIFDQPITSEVVISNFRYSLIQKNISNHLACFSDPSMGYDYSYRFVPDADMDAIKFLGWNLDDEKNYLTAIFTQSDNISLVFRDVVTFTDITQSPDSVQTNPIRYELRINFESGEEVYTGTMFLKMSKNANALWAIYYWKDTRAETIEYRSWSNLKANKKN
ncbi:MAG: hypothetical protein E4H13_04400 [Calditrichales bacterium]|nr:MAG: hypothetical protein E4H13_04400 [Calditrichales bacterium]